MPSARPKTVANFLDYVRAGHFDNTLFHRVIDGFMIQGGGMSPDMRQKPTRAPIENEARNGAQERALHRRHGAHVGDPHSATAQFFINVADNDFLDSRRPTPTAGVTACSARLSRGTDVVDKIKAVPTGNRGAHQNVPKQDVIIERAEEIAG